MLSCKYINIGKMIAVPELTIATTYMDSIKQGSTEK